MKLKLFSLFDRVANIYGAPFVAVNAESALRSVVQESRNPDAGPLYSHPQDFVVVAVGSFNNESGELEDSGLPQWVGNVAVLPVPPQPVEE